LTVISTVYDIMLYMYMFNLITFTCTLDFRKPVTFFFIYNQLLVKTLEESEHGFQVMEMTRLLPFPEQFKLGFESWFGSVALEKYSKTVYFIAFHRCKQAVTLFKNQINVFVQSNCLGIYHAWDVFTMYMW